VSADPAGAAIAPAGFASAADAVAAGIDNATAASGTNKAANRDRFPRRT
jgi:hypothetical protein